MPNILQTSPRRTQSNNEWVNILNNSECSNIQLAKEIREQIVFLDSLNLNQFDKEQNKEISHSKEEIKKYNQKLWKGFSDTSLIKFIKDELIKIDSIFKKKITAILNGKERKSLNSKVTASNNNIYWNKALKFWESSTAFRKTSSNTNTSNDKIKNINNDKKEINTNDLVFMINYTEFKRLNTVTKKALIMYINWIKEWITKYDYLKQHKVIKNNVENICNILLDKKDYNSELLNNYNKEKNKIIKNAKSAKDSLSIVWVDESLIGSWETITSIDPYITDIDDNIKSNLYNAEWNVKTAEQLKKIWLWLSLDLTWSNNFKNWELSRYFDRLDNKSIEKLRKEYNINDLDVLKKKFIKEITEKFNEWFSTEFNNIQNILETNDLQIKLFWKDIIFKTLEDRNFALSSTLYFIEGFSKDPDYGVAITLFLLWKIYNFGELISSTGLSFFLWDFWKVLSVWLITFMVWYHTHRKYKQKFKENKIQEEYNNDSKKYLENNEAPDEIKRRWKIIKTIEKRLKIESKNDPIDSSMYDQTIKDLKEFERTQISIKSNNVFFARLFKTIYKHDWAMWTIGKAIKWLMVPWTAWIIEELKWSPNVRWREEKWFLKPIKSLLNAFPLSNINWNKEYTAIQLDEFEWTFEQELIKFSKESEKIIQADSINKTFKNVKISFKNDLIDYIIKEVEEDLKTNDAIEISEDLKIKITNIKDVLIKLETLVDKTELSQYKKQILNIELKEFIDTINNLDNFKDSIDNLKKKLINLLILEEAKIDISTKIKNYKEIIKDLTNIREYNNFIKKIMEWFTDNMDETEIWKQKIKAGKIITSLDNIFNNVGDKNFSLFKSSIESRLKDIIKDPTSWIDLYNTHLEELSNEIMEIKNKIIKEIANLRPNVKGKIINLCNKWLKISDATNNKISNLWKSIENIQNINTNIDSFSDETIQDKIELEFITNIDNSTYIKKLNEKLTKLISIKLDIPNEIKAKIFANTNIEWDLIEETSKNLLEKIEKEEAKKITKKYTEIHKEWKIYKIKEEFYTKYGFTFNEQEPTNPNQWKKPNKAPKPKPAPQPNPNPQPRNSWSFENTPQAREIFIKTVNKFLASIWEPKLDELKIIDLDTKVDILSKAKIKKKDIPFFEESMRTIANAESISSIQTWRIAAAINWTLNNKWKNHIKKSKPWLIDKLEKILTESIKKWIKK